MNNQCLVWCTFAVIVGGPSIDASKAQTGQGEAVAESDATADRVFRLASDQRHTLWIPPNYVHRKGGIDLLVDFHGSPRVVRESCRSAGMNCVVVSVTYGGLSSVYRRPFGADRQLFANILDEALAKLRQQTDFSGDVAWRRVAVSSFSAGFGAVRELLKTPDYFNRIDGIYLVDSLYCGYVGDGTEDVEDGVVHPGLMKDFLRYAKASADGKKVMVVTHCDGPTPGYASTRETADYLLDKLELSPEPTQRVVDLSGANSGLQLYRQATRKGFHLYGSPGGNVTDHLQHLRHMANWLPLLPLDKLGTSGEVE